MTKLPLVSVVTDFRTFGGSLPRYHYAMDYDLWLRVGRAFPVSVIDGILSGFRFHDDSKSVDAADSFYPEMRRISRRNGGRFFSRGFLHQRPRRHPHLFKLLILARRARSYGRLAPH